jgi:hypothetical protein
MRVHLLVLLAVPLSIYAQPVSIGVKAGVPFNDPMGRYGESRPYTIGPTVEVRLPAGFAIEGAALYRRVGQTYSYIYGPNILGGQPDTTTTLNTRLRGNAWDFTLTGKYYFNRRARWQPFVGTGWALRTIGWNYNGSTTTVTSGSRIDYPFSYSDRSQLNVGAAVAVGVRLRTGRISWVPELRFTRWGGQSSNYAPSARNDGGFYLGIRF